MAERELYYNPLRTGELNQSELLVDIETICKSNGQQISQFSQRYPWKDRFPDMVYTWTVDFHPAPSACNIATYKDIGVILHPEIDHPPFCTFSGFCRNRMNPVFGLGGYMAGFALDPDHTALKRDFYNVYKNDPEFQRIDVFMCSHPLANCELFEPFQKPMIIFATTRYEFGRNDQEIGWRVREIRRWNSWGELVDRQRNLTKFVQKYHKAGLLALTANSKYDAEYMFYFTGIKTEYIPSWCGDADSSYGQRQNWVGCQLPADHKHQPTQNIAVIVPFKRMHTPAAFYEGLQLAEKNYTEVFQTTPPSVKHSADAIRDHSPETYRQYRAVIHIPYQPSTTSYNRHNICTEFLTWCKCDNCNDLSQDARIEQSCQNIASCRTRNKDDLRHRLCLQCANACHSRLGCTHRIPMETAACARDKGHTYAYYVLQ
jgi:hypothetical protein